MQTKNIRTRPDGSIDTAFYMQRGRVHRSEAAHQLVKNICDEARADVPRKTSWIGSFFGARQFSHR